MAQKNCAACDDLKNDAPNFVVNGLTDTEIASLKNNTGLNPSNKNNDCTDLSNMNDCLIGNMQDEIDAYDVCDWKDYTKQFVGNAWTLFAGNIAAICGLWTNVKKLWDNIDKILCMIDYISKGASFSFGEYSSDTNSYIVAGKGVSFLNVSSSGTASDIGITYIAGGLARLSGSCKFYKNDFTDGATCYNYDNNGVNPIKSRDRKGNPNWVTDGSSPGGSGSELVYEIRIKLSEFPQIGRFFTGPAINAEGGGYHAIIRRFAAGTYAAGQHGACNVNTGEPEDASSDRGHLVPDGWEYLQVRITWIDHMNADGNQYSPNGLFGVRMNTENIDC